MAYSSKSSGNFALLVVVLLVAYYFRAQLLALLQSVSPALASAVAPALSAPALGPTVGPGSNTGFLAVLGGDTGLGVFPGFSGLANSSLSSAADPLEIHSIPTRPDSRLVSAAGRTE
jgi:hypothetical protein